MHYVYVFGGVTVKNIVSDMTFKFDMLNNTWQEQAKMSMARKDCQVKVINDEVYIIGGVGNNEWLILQAEKYITVENTWQWVEESHSAYVLNHFILKIYIFIILHDMQTYQCYIRVYTTEIYVDEHKKRKVSNRWHNYYQCVQNIRI